MKIGIDGRTLQDKNYSGVSEYTLKLLQELFKLDPRNEYRLFYNSSHDISPRLPIFEQANIVSEKFDYPNKLLNYLMLKPFGRPQIDRLLGGCEVFFMPHYNFFGLSKKAKLVLTIHDLSFLRNPEFFSWRKNFWHKQLGLGRLIKRADRIVAISQNTKNDIVDFFKVDEAKISVIYSGVESVYRVIDKTDPQLEKVRQRYNLGSKFILILGTIEPRKNIDTVIKAFEKLKATSQPDLQLVIAGGWGWRSGAVKAAFKKSKYQKDINILGYVDRDDKPFIYNLASVLAFPSFYEGFGFPPLEAMASGVPVVSSYASSIAEVVGDAGVYADPFNVTNWSIAINEVLSNDNLRARLIARGLVQSAKFKWTETAQAYLKTFSEVC